MVVLTKDQILKEIKKRNIKITPFNEKNIGPASIDLTLDNKFRLFKKKKTLKLDDKIDYKKHSELIKADKLVLKPGDFVLGITKEKIKLSEGLCAWLGGRSRYARFGLLVHITAAFIHPGINNKQVLEIKNISSNDLVIKAGTKICQFIIERTEGKAKYKGKFQKQEL
jgi:dCTP deaminase